MEFDNELQRALDESRQRGEVIQALLEGSRGVLSLSDFEDSARSIFDSCKHLIGASAGYIALVTDDGKENEVVFLDTGQAPCLLDPDLPMPMRGLRELVYSTGKAVYENDFASSRWEELLPSGHACLDNVLFAPLRVKDYTVGLLGLANKPGGFTEYDTKLAGIFGELASIALLNSRSLESLRSGEDRFRAVAQTANDAIITMDNLGKISFWNEAAADIFGYQSKEMIGKPLDIIMVERSRSGHQKGIEGVVSTEEKHLIGKTVEMAGLRSDGREIPVELSLSTWKLGEETFYTGIVRDISERKRAEEEIQSLARFPSENRNPVLRLSQDGTILYANDASAPLLAYWTCQVGQKLPDTWRLLATEAISSGKVREAEISCDKGIFSLDFTPVVEGGYVNVYGRDVAEQKRAEALLIEQNQFIMTVFESLGHPFYVIDANDYSVKMANSAAYSGELSETVTCYSLLHDHDKPCGENQHVCPLEEIRRTMKPVVTEHVHIDLAGNEGTFEVHAHPIFDGQGNIPQIIEYTLDITERKRMEKALQERSHQVGERVKELNCLYGIAALVERPGVSVEEILQGTAELIPPSWQYPDITGARVILEGQEFSTQRFEETASWQQSADIIVGGQRSGVVEVCYLEAKLASEEGPFLKEERSLINAIAERLGEVVEHERAEEALRESEARWRSLTETSPDHILTLDTDLKIQFANYPSPGLTVDQLIGKPIYTFIDKGRQAEIKAILEGVLKSGRSAHYETTYHDPDGGDIYYESIVTAREVSGSNQIAGLTLSARDITERKQVAEALQQAHDELEERVLARTAELENANQKLQVEIVRRRQAHEAERQARQIAEILREASQALTLTLDLDKVMNILLDYLGRLVPFDSASISLLMDEAQFRVRAVRGYKEGLNVEPLLAPTFEIPHNSPIRPLIMQKQSIVIDDTRTYPGWSAHPGFEQGASWLGVPLVANDKVIGLCGLDKTEPGFFSKEHLQLAKALVSQATVAIQNAWLFEQVRTGRQRLQSLSRRLVEVQEKERLYIARELHDEAGQALAALKVGLRLLERDAYEPEAILTGVAGLRLTADEVLENLHRLAVDLRPASLDHLGLVPALRQYMEVINDRYGLIAQFEVVNVNDRLPTEMETALYRIVQEAITNVTRYAQATRVDVLLEQRQDTLALIVEDNGVGFDPAAARQGDRLGLFGMRERAEMLGGELLVESAANRGTTILVEVPYVHSHPHRG